METLIYITIFIGLVLFFSFLTYIMVQFSKYAESEKLISYRRLEYWKKRCKVLSNKIMGKNYEDK